MRDDGPVKNESRAHPVAAVWRPVLRQIVSEFARGNYSLDGCILPVEPVSASAQAQIRASLVAYGEELVELPEESWETSIAQWMGMYWDCLVDLWTAESGSSDLVLGVRVYEDEEKEYRFSVGSVYVP